MEEMKGKNRLREPGSADIFTTKDGRRIQIIAGRQVTGEDILAAAYLDRSTYEEEYFLTVETCVGYISKNPYIYTMAVDTATGRIIAYLNFSPVTKAMYETIRSGEVLDTVITPEDIVPYTPDTEIYAYMSSIVVAAEYRGQSIALSLFRHFFRFLRDYTNENRIVIRRIVADAVTEEGYRLAGELGFDYVKDSGHDSKIMEFASNKTGIRVTEWNKDLLKIYRRLS